MESIIKNRKIYEWYKFLWKIIKDLNKNVLNNILKLIYEANIYPMIDNKMSRQFKIK